MTRKVAPSEKRIAKMREYIAEAEALNAASLPRYYALLAEAEKGLAEMNQAHAEIIEENPELSDLNPEGNE